MAKYKQFVFDDDFNINSEDVIDYYKSFDEMKDEYKEFIDNTPLINITDDEYIYCPNCLELLNKNYCSKCDKKYDTREMMYYDLESKDSYCTFLILDVVYDEVIAYIIKCFVNYKKGFSIFKNKQIEIDDILHVRSDGLLSLLNGKFYSFKLYDEALNDEELSFLDDIEHQEVFDFFEDGVSFVYFDNFNELENSKLYKYSYKYLKDDNKDYNLARFLCYPVYYKQFEYLNKMKLYNLADNSPYAIKKGKSFYDSFKIPKSYYEYIKENDIKYRDLISLQIFPSKDKKINGFVKDLLDLFSYNELKELTKYIDIIKLYEYFKKNKINIYDYYDYISCIKKLKLNIKDKNVLYPKDFNGEHNKLYKEVVISNDKNINDKLNKIGNLLRINEYEDDKYIIFPALSIDDLIDESSQMSNCVRIYSERIVSGECQIYFMRYKRSKNKSLVTIEVKNNKVVQARTKFNKKTTDEQNKVIKEFEKRLIEVKIN